MSAHRSQLWSACLAIAAALLLLPIQVEAQSKKPSKTKTPEVSPIFQEAIAQAKKSKQPLVMFGTAPNCSRCKALKEGMTTQPEIKELLEQYVSTEVPFAGREFVAIYDLIVRQDAKYKQPIGSPSVFIFTSEGQVVYAGPNDPNGMQPNDTFKKLLQEGLDKNSSPKPSAKPTK